MLNNRKSRTKLIIYLVLLSKSLKELVKSHNLLLNYMSHEIKLLIKSKSNELKKQTYVMNSCTKIYKKLLNLLSRLIKIS